MAPALQATRLDLLTTLKDLAGAVTGGSGSARFRKALVIAQVALSFLLLMASGTVCKDARKFEEHTHRVREGREPGLVSDGSGEERLHGCAHRSFYTDTLREIRALRV